MLKVLELEYMVRVGKMRGFVSIDELVALVGTAADCDVIVYELRVYELYDCINEQDLPIIGDVDEVSEIDKDDINFNVKLFNHINYLARVGSERGYVTEGMISEGLPQSSRVKRALALMYGVLNEQGVSIREEEDIETVKHLNERQVTSLLHSMFRKIHEILNTPYRSDLPYHYKHVRGIIQTVVDFLDKTPEQVISTPQNQLLLGYFHQIESLIMKKLNEDQVMQNCLYVRGILEVFLAVYEGLYGTLPS